MSLSITLGFLGGLSNGILGILSKREERKLAVAKLKHQLQLTELEIERESLLADIKEGEDNRALIKQQVEGSYEGLTASINASAKLAERAPVWVLAVMAMMRPVITASLIIMTSALALYTVDLGVNSPAFTDNPVKGFNAIVQDSKVIIVLLELVQLTVAWWFGDRSFKRAVENANSQI